MSFTTQFFVFIFLPISMVLYYLILLLQNKGVASRFLARIRALDIILVVIGSVFYMWTCFDDLFRLYIYIFVVYVFGIFLERHRKNVYKKKTGLVEIDVHRDKDKDNSMLILIGALFFVVFVLIHFKYTNMLASVWNYLFKDMISGKSIVAPLGISFITFSSISYLVDIYWNKASAEKFLDCALYLTFFPKVVSGPIVLWRDFIPQILGRKVELNKVVDGIQRIMMGFAKKLILADTFGNCIASCAGSIDRETAIGVALLYMLQIYYDFSGYSDIAIGLSEMLGFSIKENFNFPYLSCSITEFWRRWHISLGTWFREYIYIPLGGSKKGLKRTVINIGIVFLLTGIWHGAGWTYMLWGILNGICNIVEKLLKDNKYYRNIPNIFKWLITMLIVFLSWELFRFESFEACKDWLIIMFGLTKWDEIPYSWQHYFDTRMITLMIVGIIGSTIWGLPKIQEIYQKVIQTKIGYLLNSTLLLGLFLLSILFMVNSNYSPFIYFQY